MNEELQKIVDNWLNYADEDLELAKRELKYLDEEILIRTVCFHCQQAIEKNLKAFLIANKVNFRKTHDLDELKELCIEIDKEFEKFEVSILSIYAVETRYPDYFEIPTLEEAKQAFQLASEIRNFINLKIKEMM